MRIRPTWWNGAGIFTGVTQGYPARYLRYESALDKREHGKKPRTVDIAEPTRLALLGMVQATSPVDSNVAFIPAQTSGTLYIQSIMSQEKQVEASTYPWNHQQRWSSSQTSRQKRDSHLQHYLQTALQFDIYRRLRKRSRTFMLLLHE